MMGSRMEFMNMQQPLPGGPPMSPQMNNIRGQMMRGPPPPGGMGGPPRMSGYGPRGMMMPEGGGAPGMMGGGGGMRGMPGMPFGS